MRVAGYMVIAGALGLSVWGFVHADAKGRWLTVGAFLASVAGSAMVAAGTVAETGAAIGSAPTRRAVTPL